MGVIQGSPPILMAARPNSLPLAAWMKCPGPVPVRRPGRPCLQPSYPKGKVQVLGDFFFAAGFSAGFEALIMASAALPCAFWAEAESSFLASLP